jgi:hypothetical protein
MMNNVILQKSATPIKLINILCLAQKKNIIFEFSLPSGEDRGPLHCCQMYFLLKLQHTFFK